VAIDSDHAEKLRGVLVDQLRADGTIASPAVETVMRKVPRHPFLPGVCLEMAYDVDAPIVFKVDGSGGQLSSVSSPRVHAVMLEQAQVLPGTRVLEIGAGGLGAAYLAELAGVNGQVTTCDIDAEVVDVTGCLLVENGYPQVQVVHEDASGGPIPFLGQVDVIVVTAETWDIPAAWVDQLRPGGRLVVPLRMSGLTRSVAFTRAGRHLRGESVRGVRGLGPMRGAGAPDGERVRVGGIPEIELHFDERPPGDVKLDGLSQTDRGVEVLSGVTVSDREGLDSLHLHLAITLPGVCTMWLDAPFDSGTVTPGVGSTLAAVEGECFGYLTRRSRGDGEFEIGFHALGPGADALAEKAAQEVQEWALLWRGGPGPAIEVYPAHTPDDQICGDRVINTAHCRIALDVCPTA